MTPELLAELISMQGHCVHEQESGCPLLISIRSLTREVSQAMGVANDEDRAFRRHSEMCAAKPLPESVFRGEYRDVKD